jgi:hypothetical protein
MVSPFAAKVVGVSFVPGFPDNLFALDRVATEAHMKGEPLTVILVRNPANAYDPNAIEVHVPALGERWAMIGHLTRPIVARMAPEIDAGVRWSAQVEQVLMHPDHLDNPGISIRCARQEEQTDG